MKTTSYKVCSHFLPAIFNGDESGLSEFEVGLLQAWMEHHEFDLTKGHFSTDSEEEADLNTCSVMSTVGDVVTLTWNVVPVKTIWAVNDGSHSWYVRASSELEAAKRAAKEVGASRVVQRDPVLFTATLLDQTGLLGGTREISFYVHKAPEPLEGN